MPFSNPTFIGICQCKHPEIDQYHQQKNINTVKQNTVPVKVVGGAIVHHFTIIFHSEKLFTVVTAIKLKLFKRLIAAENKCTDNLLK